MDGTSRQRSVSLLLVTGLLLATGCSAGGDSNGGSGGSSADPCPIVRWWADNPSGGVPKPDDAPESRSEAQDIADSLPSNEGQAFMQLYDDLASNLSDAAYANEVDHFEFQFCR